MGFVAFGCYSPIPLEQQWRAERALALARLFIATAALAAISFAPGSTDQYVPLAYPLLAGYVAEASTIDEQLIYKCARELTQLVSPKELETSYSRI